LEQRENVNTVAIVPITGDRGLAGAFNAQVLRRAFAIMRDEVAAGREVRFYGSGKKAQSTLRFRRLTVGETWTGFSDRPTYQHAQAIAHKLAEDFVEGEVDRVTIVYNAFVSPLVQTVTVSEILPVSAAVLEGSEEDTHGSSHPVDFFFEPEPRDILGRLLPV